MPEVSTSERPTRRAAVVCRHPATLRQVAQALGVAGLGVRQAIGPNFLPRSQPGEFEAVVLDLDVNPATPPVQLVEAVVAHCPATPIVVVAGLSARHRLIEALAHSAVAGLCPKTGTWSETAAAHAPVDGPDEQDLGVALRRLSAHAKVPSGPAPYLLGGCTVEERVVGSTAEKDDALDEVMGLGQRLGLSDEKLRRIEVVTDELLLNAIFDAPRELDGSPRFAGANRRAPLTLPAQAQVRLRYGADGRGFVVSVGDRFGSLTRAQVATHVARVLEASGPRPRGGLGGAGLGLVLIFGAATQLAVQVVPGVFTEVTAAVHIAGSNRAALVRGSALYLYL